MPDFIGFVFAPSRRRVDLKTAAMLKEILNSRIKAVGVFVNEDIKTVSEIYQDGIIDWIQLHGEESDEYIKRLKETCDCPVVKSVGVGDTLPPLPMHPDFLLFDTLSAQRGGIGKSFDWRILEAYCGKQFFLAGGISADNVAGAVQLLDPFCMDVSSGAETDGYKDPEKMIKLVQAVREMPQNK